MHNHTSRLIPTLLSSAIVVALAGGAAYAAPASGQGQGMTSSAAAQTSQSQQDQASAAQDNEQDAARSRVEAQKLSTVVVTGTRTENRTESSSLTPIDVIPSQVLTQSGSVTLGKALEQTVPSMNFPQFGASDAFAMQRPFELRGMAPDQVLVLINGERMHAGALIPTLGQVGQGSQAVDINTIPMAAIDHVEVLRQGASAQYGSDAIAGVVNVILKSGPEGGHVAGTAGEYSTGDGLRWNASADVGFPLGGDSGWMRVAATAGKQQMSNRAGLDDRPGFTRLGKKFYFGITPFEDKNVLINTQLELAPAVTFYGFGHWSQRKANPRAFYRYGADAPIPKSPIMKDIFPDGDGFLPIEHGDGIDWFLTLGLKGRTDGGFTWDVSATQGANKMFYSTNRSINFAYWDDFGSSPRDMHDGTLTASQTTLDADFSQPLGERWTLSFGLQYLRQGYKVEAGEEASWYVSTTSPETGGAQGFAGWGPQDTVDVSRHDVSEYVQLEGQVTDTFSTSIAARHEDYSDFGTTTSFALSGRFDFTPAFALRGTVSTGFRAPGLGQQNYSQTSSTSFPEGNALGLPEGIYLRGLVPVDNKLAKLLGAQPLEPEKSRSITGGIVWSPTQSFTSTLDLYQIRIKNLIAISSTISMSSPEVRDYLAANGIADPEFVGMNYFTNAGKLRVKGVGWVNNYNHFFDNGGHLTSTLSFSYHKNEVYDINPNPPELDALGDLGFKRLSRAKIKGTLADTMPRSKIIFTNTYDKGNWGVTATATRYGRFTTYSDTDPDLDVVYPHQWLIDMAVTYYKGGWTFSVGSDNMFNGYPMLTPTGQNTNGVYPYPTSSPFGYFGAYVYGKVKYSW